jgi:peptidoglycan/LPS O-acetylase OafA/YrhL
VKGTRVTARLPFIDALRAVAIFAVMVRHLPPELGRAFGPLYPMGGRGVDLFFVLSGYLIATAALDRASLAPGRRWNQALAYWLLRISRIFPLYFLLLALFAIGAWGIDPEVTRATREHFGRFATFTSNSLESMPAPLGLFWSLAIEEQFYLAVGVLVVVASSTRDRLRIGLGALAALAIAGSIAYRHRLGVLHDAKELGDGLFVLENHFGTLARMDQLAIGVALAVFAPLLNRLPWARVQSPALNWSALAFSLGVLIWLPPSDPFGLTLLGLCFAALVAAAQRPGAELAQCRPLERTLLRPLSSIGQLSFGLYLFHPVTRGWLQKLLGNPPGFFWLWFVGTWALAWLSFRMLEAPMVQVARARSDALLDSSTGSRAVLQPWPRGHPREKPGKQ